MTGMKRSGLSLLLIIIAMSLVCLGQGFGFVAYATDSAPYLNVRVTVMVGAVIVIDIAAYWLYSLYRNLSEATPNDVV